MEIELIRKAKCDDGYELIRYDGEELKHAFCHTYAVWLDTKSISGISYAKIEASWNDYIKARDRWISFRDREL